jgi:hypothetical protein
MGETGDKHTIFVIKTVRSMITWRSGIKINLREIGFLNVDWIEMA